MNFTVDSELNGGSPQFTSPVLPLVALLPLSLVPETVSGGMTVLNNAVTAQYTHTLNVTEILGGQYQCNVTNNKSSTTTAHFKVQGKLLR